MSVSSIQWTEHTWNPVTGCSKVSPGCAHCYAEGVALRFWGSQYPKIEFCAEQPPRAREFTDVWVHEDRLDQPLKRRKPTTYFVNSMSDLFHEDVPDAFIADVFGVMARCPQHTFQILTKRAERMKAWMDKGDGWMTMAVDFSKSPIPGMAMPWPLPNVWLGVSVENRKWRSRIGELQRTPAAVRFLSLEPLLEDIGDLQLGREWCANGEQPIDWCIVGGESGAGARPFDLAWARSIVQQCKAAGVACFVKQLGSAPMLVQDDRVTANGFPRANRYASVDGRILLRDRKGGDITEFPPDLQIREFPKAEAEGGR